jgi:hypothetical protein
MMKIADKPTRKRTKLMIGMTDLSDCKGNEKTKCPPA